MIALRAHHAGGRRASATRIELGLEPDALSDAADRDVLSTDALPPPRWVDGAIGACTRTRRRLDRPHPAPEARTTPKSGPGLFVSTSRGDPMPYQPDTLAIHAGQVARPGHQRARRADLRDDELRVQRHAARRRPVRAARVRQHLHPHHEPDERRVREAHRGARRRHRGAGPRERAGRRDPDACSTSPARATTWSRRRRCTAARTTCSPTLAAQVGHHHQVRGHPQSRPGAGRHRRRHPAPLRRDHRQPAARRARLRGAGRHRPRGRAFPWSWTTPSAPPRSAARSSTAPTSSSIRPPSGSAATARPSAAWWSTRASSTGPATRRGHASPNSPRPIPRYHGLVYTEAFGPAAFIIKLRVQLLRDLGPGALAVQLVPVPAGAGDPAAPHPATLRERARGGAVAGEGSAGGVGLVSRAWRPTRSTGTPPST